MGVQEVGGEAEQGKCTDGGRGWDAGTTAALPRGGVDRHLSRPGHPQASPRCYVSDAGSVLSFFSSF